MVSSAAAAKTQHDRHFSIDDAGSDDDDGGRYSTQQIIADEGRRSAYDDDDGAFLADGADDDDPDCDRTTAVQTFLHILKGNIGPGCLSLPWATSVLGIPLSLATLAALCIITSFNCWAMVRWKRRHASDRRDVTYADLGEIAYGPKFRAYVIVCVCATQLCVCTVFFSFMGENISAVMRAAGVPLLSNNRVVITMVLPMAAFLSCAPNLRVLAPVTAFGMTMLFVAFGIIGVIIGRNWESHDVPTMTTNWTEIPLAMCAFLYSFEAINLVMPIEAAMMDPTKFDFVFSLGMITVTTIYAIFACLCVSAFGSIDNGSVSAFLEEHAEEFSARHLVLAANFIVSASVLASYPLQMFPAINLISQLRDRNAHPHHASTVPQSTQDCGEDENGNTMETYGGMDSREASTANFMPLDTEQERLENELGTESSHFTKQGGLFQNRTTFEGDSPILRMTLVLGTYLFAVLIPNVQELISLSGALAGSSCALIIPPLIELRSILESKHRISPTAVLRYILMIIGVVFLIVGTAASIRDIAKAFKEGGGR